MKTAYIAICSAEYLNYYRELYKSLQQHSPDSNQILYFINGNFPYNNGFDQIVDTREWYYDCNSTYNKLERICSLRARVVLDTFNQDYDKVIFCGAKLKFFSPPTLLESLLNDHQAVVTPHITEPLPEDGKFPSNASVSFTGHISTDLVGFRNTPEIVKFLTWQDEIMKNNCKTTDKTYLDQSWLNFLPFFVENVKILKDPGYNIAYWNFKQRSLGLTGNNQWVVKGSQRPNGSYEYNNLVCFQFSGLDLNNPKNISTHQNRYKAEGDFLEFLKNYADKIKLQSII